MAKIGKPATTVISPPIKKSKTKSTTKPETTSKPSATALKPIQFKVPASMHQEIKLYTVEQGITMTELFLSMYKEYRSKHG